MIRLQMAGTKPVIWLFGDEAAFDVRDDLKRHFSDTVDIQCFGYTGATFDSVIDAQLFIALGSGTSPAGIVVVAGAYDALVVAMGGGSQHTAALEISHRLDRLPVVLGIRKLDKVQVTWLASLSVESLCNKIGMPVAWALDVLAAVSNDITTVQDTRTLRDALLVDLGFGKDIGHESS